jgi:hypothetical protein
VAELCSPSLERRAAQIVSDVVQGWTLGLHPFALENGIGVIEVVDTIERWDEQALSEVAPPEFGDPPAEGAGLGECELIGRVFHASPPLPILADSARP